MDMEDRFHILFQDSQGNMNYSYLDGDSLKTVPVLNSKTPSSYNKHFFLLPLKNNIHFFYILQHESSYILAYQVLSDGKITNPKVVDYVSNSVCPASFVCDRASNIYAFYQSSDGKYLQLGYKKYNTGQKFWSEFTPVTKYSGTCEHPRTIIDNNGIIHLCYQRITPRLYEMVYQQKITDKNLWTDEVIVHSSVHPFENASILWLNDNIIVYWVREDNIYYNAGEQSGNVWNKPLKLNFSAGRQLVCISYRTNNVYESARLAVNNIPGSFVGGLKLAFHQQSQDDANTLSAEELKNLILESLKLIKVNVEELKDADSSIREELSALSNTCRELEKELIKCNVKMNFLETHISQVKTFGSRLDEIENKIKK